MIHQLALEPVRCCDLLVEIRIEKQRHLNEWKEDMEWQKDTWVEF